MTAPATRSGRTPIAIIGIGCRFPGGIDGPGTFWELVSRGGDAIGLIPTNRMDRDHYYDPRPAEPGHIMSRWGGYLDHIEDFDAGFFGISPREAERMDPQHRLLCETSWEALEDAGQDVRQLAGSRTGVFVGQMLSDFESRVFADAAGVDFYMTVGSARYATSGRLSYFFDLRGPSVTLDTGCSASLAALHLAVKSLQSGETELSLAGGVNVILQPQVTIGFSQSRMMAADGRSKFGDASADGYVRSEGAAVVVLKPLERALADGDRVYAVIHGSAVSNDGRTSGSLGTTSRAGQEELLRTAYADAGISPGRVRYVEAHGTGTQVGDPVELAALGAVLSDGRAAGNRALVGSVKTNFGHTEGAAGIAGVIKAALALHHDRIPASLHFKNPNPKVAWSSLPFDIPRALASWPPGAGSRVAGVNSFGITGTNAHVVLEEAPVTPGTAPAAAPRATALLVLSAKNRDALSALAVRYAERLEGDAESLHDVCFSAATRRTPLETRAAFVATDAQGMILALKSFAAGDPARAEGFVAGEAPASLVFVCPGQGGQWLGMGRALAESEPVFRAALEACELAAKPWSDFSILEQLYAAPGSPAYQLDDIGVQQPMLVAMSIGFAALFKSFGVVPDAVVGHSFGEIVAAHLAGILDLDQAMRIACVRAALVRRAAGQGTMALVELPAKEMAARLSRLGDRVAVAGDNGPRTSIISGDLEGVQQVLSECEHEGIFCRAIKVDFASHGPQMAPLAGDLEQSLARVEPTKEKIPIYSTVFARRAAGEEFTPAYWGKNLRQAVLFRPAIEQMLEAGSSIFIELGPHPVLSPAVQQTAQALKKDAATIACGRRDEPEQAFLLAALAGAWTAGYPVNFRRVMPGGRVVPLPSYPWQRERLWTAAAELVPPGASGRLREARPTEDALGWIHRLAWKPAPIASAGNGGAPPRESVLILCSRIEEGAPLAAALGAVGTRAEVKSLEDLEAALEAARASAERVRAVVVFAPDTEDVEYLPVRAVQAVAKGAWRATPRLFFVTRGSQNVSDRAATRVAVHAAALWGTGRAVAEEQPELWGGLVDLEPAAPADEANEAAALARHLLEPSPEEQVAFRGGDRFALRLLPAARAGAPSFAPREDGAYLITGGLGDVGLHVARALAARGARRLILLGRTPLPPRDTWAALDESTPAGRRVQTVRALESLGAAVHVAPVDVGDEAALTAFVKQYQAEGWPAIRGVFHAAVVLEPHLAAHITAAEFDVVMRPKLGAAVLLDRLFPDVDAFVLFSSVIGTLGQVGATSYAAANVGLDALAADRRARGLAAVSIAWGVWEGTTRVAAEVAELSRQGVRGFSADVGTTLLLWLTSGAPAAVAVLPMDWSAFRTARAGRGARLYSELVANDAAAGTGADLGARLSAMEPAERRRILEQVVRDAVARVLKLSPSRIEPRSTFGSLGMGSLLSMELRNRLEAALGRSLSATLAYNYPTLVALVDHLAGGSDLAASPVAAASSPISGTAAPPLEQLTEIAALSDEEAARALRRGRSRGAP
jgi:acyl transferase domain-containing protein/acyl carrier protein